MHVHLIDAFIELLVQRSHGHTYKVVVRRQVLYELNGNFWVYREPVGHTTLLRRYFNVATTSWGVRTNLCDRSKPCDACLIVDKMKDNNCKNYPHLLRNIRVTVLGPTQIQHHDSLNFLKAIQHHDSLNFLKAEAQIINPLKTIY